MTPPITSRPGFRVAALSALLFAGTVLLFCRTVHFGFLNYDDPSYVTANPHVRAGLTWAGVVWAFTGIADYWHPLTWLSHMLDWQLYGSDPAGHHVTSVLWHACNAVLAFLVFRRLAGGIWRSAFAAALFAWHPLRVESVAWIAERKDVMSGCFFLLTLLAYLRYATDDAAGRRARRYYILALLAFAAGLMSKPMVVSLPLVLLLLDVWPLRRVGDASARRTVLIEKLPFFALSGATAIATLVMQRDAGAFVLHLGAGARAENAVVSLARYLGKFFWPFDLVVCYPHPGFWPGAAVLGASFLVIALAALAWWQRRSRPWIAVGLAWFVITLLPVLGLVQVGFQSMADRYTYLPMLGVELALIWSIPVGRSRAARIAEAAVAVGVLGALAARTWNQEPVWRDSIALFRHAVRVSDRNDVAEDFLSSALFAAGRYDEAATHAERAVALNPRNDRARESLGAIREHQGRWADAIASYRAALQLRPDNNPLRCQLGLLELGRGHAAEARALMLPALRADMGIRARTLDIARQAAEHGNPAGAHYLLELVVAAAPNDAAAHAALGDLLVRYGDDAAGVAEWRRAFALNPALPGLREKLSQFGP